MKRKATCRTPAGPFVAILILNVESTEITGMIVIYLSLAALGAVAIRQAWATRMATRISLQPVRIRNVDRGSRNGWPR